MTAYTGFDLRKAGAGERGQTQKYIGYVTLGSADAAGTTLNTLSTSDTITWSNKLPSKFKVVGGAIWGVEVDTNATPTSVFKIGNSDDDDGYLLAATGAVNKSNSLAQPFYLKFDGALLGTTITNQSIKITPTANVATLGSGNVYIELEIEGI